MCFEIPAELWVTLASQFHRATQSIHDTADVVRV
jgi:hypothetical protein